MAKTVDEAGSFFFYPHFEKDMKTLEIRCYKRSNNFSNKSFPVYLRSVGEEISL